MHCNSMNGIFSLKMEDDAHDDWPAIKTISLLQVRGEKTIWKKKNENNGNSEMISVYHCFIRFPLLFVRRRKLLEIVANYSGIISFELIWKESAFSLMIELCSSIVCRRLHLNWKLAKFSSIMKIKFGIEVIWWSAQAKWAIC